MATAGIHGQPRGGPEYLPETRAFFACRAATWDAKFGDDLPAYRAAVAEAALRRGGVAIDVGCGTGEAIWPGVGAAHRALLPPTGNHETTSYQFWRHISDIPGVNSTISDR